MTPERLAEIKARVEKARQEVFGLYNGKRKFTMSIPPDRERDTDCILVDALKDVDELAVEVERLQDERKQMTAFYLRWLSN